MLTLSRTGIQIPDLPTDPFAYRVHLAAIAQAVESQGVIFTSGVAGSRPPAGKVGRVHLFTDTGEFWWDTGASWMQVNPAPVANAAAGTPSLRRLGTGSTDAAAGSHAAQHAANGTDPLPSTPWARLWSPGGTAISPAAWIPMTWSLAESSGDGVYLQAGDNRAVSFPFAGMWVVSIWTTDETYTPRLRLGSSWSVIIAPYGHQLRGAITLLARVTMTGGFARFELGDDYGSSTQHPGAGLFMARIG